MPSAMHSAQRRSLQRFLAYVAPYRTTIALATACGVVRYLIPLVLPWTLKIVVDEFLVPAGGRPRTQLHLLMVGLIAVYVVYGIASYWRSYLAGLARRLREQSRAIHDQLQEISGELHEQFGAISTIQSFTQEEAEARAFHKQSERFLHSVLSNVQLQSVALGATGFLTAIGPILVLWFGALEVLGGRLTIGTLMAFYAYLGLLYQPVQRLTELNLIVASSLAAMDRIFEVFDTYPEVREQPVARVLGRIRGEIVFDDVGFRYDGGPPVLEHFRHHLSAGTTVALVGPSGAGKSTLAKLLPRFYDVTGGRITIDGTDIRDVTLRSLRQNIAIVAQEPMLLSGTVAENLRYGRPEATDADLADAARLAFASEFIARLPRGYETEIGERGLGLSGGEKD